MTTGELRLFLQEELEASKPLRLVSTPSSFVFDEDLGFFVDRTQRDTDSIEWKNVENNEWEHLMSVPRGNIYKYRSDDYRSRFVNASHASLYTVYNKLLTHGLITSSQKYKFTSL